MVASAITCNVTPVIDKLHSYCYLLHSVFVLVSPSLSHCVSAFLQNRYEDSSSSYMFWSNGIVMLLYAKCESMQLLQG